MQSLDRIINQLYISIGLSFSLNTNKKLVKIPMYITKPCTQDISHQDINVVFVTYKHCLNYYYHFPSYFHSLQRRINYYYIQNNANRIDKICDKIGKQTIYIIYITI